MQYDLQKQPSNTVLEAVLDEGERLNADPGSMVSRSETMRAETKMDGSGGVTGMLSRAISDEQKLVSNTFTADADGAHVLLAPDTPGDVVPIDLAETGRIKVQSGAPLAWTDDVETQTALNNSRNFFSSGELTVLAMQGDGLAFLSAYGSVVDVDVTEADPLVVDEDHLIAWTDGLSLSRERDGGLKSTVLGGEGYVTHFTGEGRVWLQTRDPLVFLQSAGGN